MFRDVTVVRDVDYHRQKAKKQGLKAGWWSRDVIVVKGCGPSKGEGGKTGELAGLMVRRCDGGRGM